VGLNNIKGRVVMNKALLYEKTENESGEPLIQCRLCSHYCLIPEGKRGTCNLRVNENGQLFTLSWGAADGAAIDPIEKKPFFHYKPNTKVLSFGSPGCNFRCLNCQNSHLSQAYKTYSPHTNNSKLLTPYQIADYAQRYNVDGIAYTYSEPTIFFEYARDTVLECRKNKSLDGIFHVLVSNGFFSREMLELASKEKLFSAINIDLKFMSDEKYQEICGGRLQPVIDNIKRVYDLRDDIHLEIINLVIPKENDSDEDFGKLSEFVASLSPDIPLHFNRFYPKHKMADKEVTDNAKLIRAKEIAQKHGMNYVYIGNASLRNSENTYCPKCNALLIERRYYDITSNVFEDLEPGEKAKCPDCGEGINIVI
jgi:pyruvate formate lyase activating enzyme